MLYKLIRCRKMINAKPGGEIGIGASYPKEVK